MPPPPETFSKIKYVSDPYTTPIQVVTHGSSAKCPQMFGGKGIKSKTRRLFEGEPPKFSKGSIRKKTVKVNKFMSTDGFKCSSPTKESNNRGDYTATFTKKYEHIPITVPETNDPKTFRAKRATRQPKNITTNPYNDGIFNKIPYITPSVDKRPSTSKKGEKMAPLTFRKKSDLFSPLKYEPEGVKRSKSEGDDVKDPTILDVGSFRPCSPCVNFRAPVTGTFSTIRHMPVGYNEKLRRHATTPDKTHPLPPKTKCWI